MERIDPVVIAMFLDLTHFERRIYAVFARSIGKAIPTEHIVTAAYGDRADGGPEFANTCVSRALQSIRKKIAPYGLVIEWRNGRGGWRRMTWAEKERAA